MEGQNQDNVQMPEVTPEQKRKAKKILIIATAVVGVLMLMCILTGVFAVRAENAEAEALLAQAHEQYEAGDLAGAIETLERGERDFDLDDNRQAVAGLLESWGREFGDELEPRVAPLLADARTALASGNVEAAESKLEQAAELRYAPSSVAATNLLSQLQESRSDAKAQSVLASLTDEQLTAFVESGELPGGATYFADESVNAIFLRELAAKRDAAGGMLVERQKQAAQAAEEAAEVQPVATASEPEPEQKPIADDAEPEPESPARQEASAAKPLGLSLADLRTIPLLRDHAPAVKASNVGDQVFTWKFDRRLRPVTRGQTLQIMANGSEQQLTTVIGSTLIPIGNAESTGVELIKACAMIASITEKASGTPVEETLKWMIGSVQAEKTEAERQFGNVAVSYWSTGVTDGLALTFHIAPAE